MVIYFHASNNETRFHRRNLAVNGSELGGKTDSMKIVGRFHYTRLGGIRVVGGGVWRFLRRVHFIICTFWVGVGYQMGSHSGGIKSGMDGSRWRSMELHIDILQWKLMEVFTQVNLGAVDFHESLWKLPWKVIPWKLLNLLWKYDAYYDRVSTQFG